MTDVCEDMVMLPYAHAAAKYLLPNLWSPHNSNSSVVLQLKSSPADIFSSFMRD